MADQDCVVRPFIERGATLDAKLAAEIMTEAEPDVRPSIRKWVILLEEKGLLVNWRNRAQGDRVKELEGGPRYRENGRDRDR